MKPKASFPASVRVPLPSVARPPVLLRGRVAAVLLLGATWAGFLATVGHFAGFETEYLLLHLVLSAAIMLILPSISRDDGDALPITLIIGVVFLAYVVKFHTFVCFPDYTTSPYWMQRFSTAWGDLELLILSFRIVTYGFTLLAVGAFLFRVWTAPVREARYGHGEILPRPLPVLVSVVSLAMITSLIIHVTGIALMGAQSTNLPYRIAGIVFYTRQSIIPALFLLLIYYGVILRSAVWFFGSIAVFILFGVTDMLLRGSRGELVFVLLMMLALLYLTRSLSRKAIAVLGMGLGGVVAAWPIMSSFRDYRVAGLGLGQALVEAFSMLHANRIGEYLAFGVQNVFGRIVGIESLLAVLLKDVRVTSPEFVDLGVTRMFTTVVMGFPPDLAHSSAPSLFGWFYLVGGAPLAILGPLLFAAVLLAAWRALPRLKMSSLPVMQALWISFIFKNVQGGALDDVPMRLLTVIAGAGGGELVLRLTCSRRRSPQVAKRAGS